MDISGIITQAVYYFYVFGIHIGFVAVTKKCFFEKYTPANIIVTVLLSPSLAANGVITFTEGIYFGNTPEETVIGHLIYYLIVIAIMAVQLPLYIKFVNPQNKSVAAFIYLCCLVFALYNSSTENSYGSSYVTGNIWFKNLFMIAAAVVFYRFVIIPMSKISRTKQERGMTVFVVIPAVAAAIRIVLIILHDAANDFVLIGTQMKNLPGFIDEYNTFLQYYNSFVREWRLYMEVYSIALYSILTILIIAFAVIVRNVGQLSEINRQNSEIKAARDNIKTLSVEVMEALAHTIDAKDKYTNGHSVRVAKYSRMIAQKMGLDEKMCEDIYYMGLLHDIGKIGVPNEIINKPDRLTDEEYDVIKTHPGIGFGILAEIRSRPDLARGALWHHERYDGKGYPEHKAGEEIPIEARIIAVADTYDAMTSNRSYRSYLPQETVRAEIEKCAGTQFDPEAARCMIAVIDEDKDYVLHE